MDLQRVQADIRTAASHFPNIDTHHTADGGLYIKALLATSVGRVYVVNVTFAGYPSVMPKVTVVAPAVKHGMHMYVAGHICYMHPSVWNPGRHDVKHALAEAAVWLNKHEVYVATGRWPGPSLGHTG